MDLPGYRPLRKAAARRNSKPVVAAIRASKKPFIYAGGGITHCGAAAELKEFAELTGIPVGLTVHGLGNFPADHYLCLQMLGMHGTVYSNYAINDADLLLALRRAVRRPRDRQAHASSPSTARSSTSTSTSREIHKNKFAHIPVHGDLKAALGGPERDARRGEERRPDRRRALPATGGGRSTHWRETEPLQFPDRDDAIIPQYAIQRLWEILRDRKQLDDTIITTGVGQHQMWAAQFFHFNQPRKWVTRGGLGTMGFGLPAALGAKVAHPDNLVIDIDGDGSFLMNVQELATAYAEKIPGEGAAAEQPAPRHGGAVGGPLLRLATAATRTSAPARTSAPYPDFVKIAEGFGVQGAAASSTRATSTRPCRDDREQRAVRAERPRAAPGTRAADDPERHDGEGHHQGVIGPRQA